MYKKYKYNIRWRTPTGTELKQVDGYAMPGRYGGLWLFVYKNEWGQWIPSELTTGMQLQGISGDTIKEAMSKVKNLLNDKKCEDIKTIRDWQIKQYGIAN